MRARRLPFLLMLLVGLGLATPPAGAATDRPLEIRLWDRVIHWQTVPGLVAQAELRDAEGLRATAWGQADESGRAALEFWDIRDAWAGNPQVRPGDTVRVMAYGQPPVTAVVPELSAETRLPTARLFGAAPPNVDLEIVLFRSAEPGTPLVRLNRTRPQGGYSESFLGLGIAPGDHGFVHFDSPEGHRFTVPFVFPLTTITVGAGTVRGLASAGAEIAVQVLDPAGNEKRAETTRVVDGTAWALAVASEGPEGAIAPGDRLQLRGPFGIDVEPTTITVTVPAQSVRIGPGPARVSGTAPAESALAIDAWGPDGQHVAQAAQSDAQGAFDLELSELAALGPGWRVAAAVEQAPGIRTRALAVVRQIVVPLHGRRITGTVAPGHPLTVTLHAEDGGALAQGTAVGDDEGRFQLYPWGQGFTGILPGLLVEAELDAGDPIELRVPQLTARVDAEADRVSGEAPPGADLRVSPPPGIGVAPVAARADGQGRYRADFAGSLDLRPPMAGSLWLADPRGHRFTLDWAAVRAILGPFPEVPLTAWAYLSGNGPAERPVRSALFDPDDRRLARAETSAYAQASGSTAEWLLYLEDETGAAVPAEPGDRLETAVGDETLALRVPELEGVVFVGEERISGRTEPDAPLTLRVQKPFDPDRPLHLAETRSGPDGRFDADLASSLDLAYNDAVLAELEMDGHRVLKALTVPGLRLDLDEARLTGTWTPETEIEVTVRGPGGARTQMRAYTDAMAGFDIALTGPEGDALRLAPGDTLDIQAPAEPGREPLRMTVPEIGIRWDLAGNRISGRATPGGALAFRIGHANLRFVGASDALGLAAIQADGRYTVDFVPAITLQPGSVLQAEYRLPEGHRVTRRATIPILSAQHGGARVCGFALPGAAVSVDLETGGRTLASARGAADLGGRFDLLLRDAGGQPVATRAGQILRADLGEGSFAFSLPPMDLSLDWPNRSGELRGPPDTEAYLFMPPRACAEAEGLRLGYGGRTEADGAWSLWLDEYRDGEGFELTLYPEGGQRVFRSVFRPRARIFLGGSRVEGRAGALETVRAGLLGPGDGPRGEAQATSDTDHAFRLGLRDASGSPVAIRAGDTLVLEAGAATERIPVEALDFDYEAGVAISIDGPPDRPITLAMTVDGGETYRFERRLNAQGRARFGAEELPPRAPWTLEDVASLQVSMPTPGDAAPGAAVHEIVVEWPPEAPGGRVFLPALLAQGSLGAVQPPPARRDAGFATSRRACDLSSREGHLPVIRCRFIGMP